MRDWPGHAIEFGIIAEDLPDAANAVTLDPARTDSDGLAIPQVTYRNSENTKRLLAYHVARAREVAEAAGALATHSPGIIRGTGWHLLGTARMGEDPATSVVNQWGRCHDVPNLYVVDGSTFVTVRLNPTATICAVALRSAQHAVAPRAAGAREWGRADCRRAGPLTVLATCLSPRRPDAVGEPERPDGTGWTVPARTSSPQFAISWSVSG
jgi:choline dehydrogenase-like flavoprotein